MVTEDKLSAKAREIVAALRALGSGWHSRADLAGQLGKKKLNPAEVAILDLLVAEGRIEASLKSTSLPHISSWLYRVQE